MSRSREPSLNTRVSRFRDGYDYDDSLATNEHILRTSNDHAIRSRDSSPAATPRGRPSYFKEHHDTALGTTLFSVDPMPHGDIDLSRPETHYDPHSNRDTTALLTPSIHVEKARGRSKDRDGTPSSDEERLLAQARKHADAHVDAYVLQQRHKEAATHHPAPQLSSSRRFYVTRWVLRILSCAVSIAIVAVLLDTLDTYKKTKDTKQAFKNGDGGGMLNVWPELMKMHPTILLLANAATAAVASLLLSVASINKRVNIPPLYRIHIYLTDMEGCWYVLCCAILTPVQVRRMTNTGNNATIFISSFCLTLWIITTAYYASWDTKETNWDLMSWACKHGKADPSYNHVNYGEVCIEMVRRPFPKFQREKGLLTGLLAAIRLLGCGRLGGSRVCQFVAVCRVVC
jgi:hypothetical protein